MVGQLSDISPVEISQMINSNHKTGFLEIESEYLIEDPEMDFKEYLESVDIDERYDVDKLTKIAVKSLQSAVENREKMTLDSLLEGESE